MLKQIFAPLFIASTIDFTLFIVFCIFTFKFVFFSFFSPFFRAHNCVTLVFVLITLRSKECHAIVDIDIWNRLIVKTEFSCLSVHFNVCNASTLSSMDDPEWMLIWVKEAKRYQTIHTCTNIFKLFASEKKNWHKTFWFYATKSAANSTWITIDKDSFMMFATVALSHCLHHFGNAFLCRKL